MAGVRMKDIIVAPLSIFNTNGKLSGPLGAYDPEDPSLFLWEADRPNWRRTGVLEQAAKGMVEEFADFPEYKLDLKRAISLLRKALRQARIKQADDGGTEDGDDLKRSQGSSLVDLARDAELWHTPEGAAFATVEVDGHHETWGLRGRPFKDWLSFQFFQQKNKSPGGQAVADALAVLSEKALFEGPEHQVFTRIAEMDGAIYLDLGNDAWEAVKVTSDEWTITDDVPVRFRRSRGMHALPHPTHRGNLGLLRDLLNLTYESDDEWAFFLGCLVEALRGRGPYPVLALYGEHGSAKSTVAKVYRRLIDPNTADLRTPPRDERDLRIQALNGWVVGYDNLSHLPEWLSNALRRLSTGGGMGTRELYSDDDEILFDGQRPIVLNGIEDIASRADLVDRRVVILLKAIPKKRRRTEKAFWRAFEDARMACDAGRPP